MICRPCAGRNHDGCKGGTWCDCQHHPIRLTFVAAPRNPEAPTQEELAAGTDLTEHIVSEEP